MEELSKKEIELIIEWYKIADIYFEERGIYMGDANENLLKKLKEMLK